MVKRGSPYLFGGRGCFLMWYDSIISLGFRFLYWSKRKLSKKLDEHNRAVRMADFNASAMHGVQATVWIGMGHCLRPTQELPRVFAVLYLLSIN